MGMFGMFGKKGGGGGADNEYGGDMVGMMKMMAGMPQMMRKPMMKGRITQLLSLDEGQRQESIRDMVGAFNSPKVKEGTREKLVATRVEILGEMPENERRTIIRSRAAALKVAPDLDEADQRVQNRVLPQISEPTRRTFTETWEYLKKNADS